MISFKKYISSLTVLILSVGLSSCGIIKKQASNITLPNYSEVVALESKQNDSKIYSINESGLIKVGDVGDVPEIDYNSKRGVYAYLINMNSGNNLEHNRIEILSPKWERKIRNFFSASDIKLSPDATKIAFRTYKDDSIQSAEGMRVYGITSGKYLKMNSEVLISGNLYKWLNDNEIMYYGISSNGNSSGKIYKYNFVSNSETQILKDIRGYCTFFIPVNGNLLYLEKNGDDSRLYYYDVNLDKRSMVSNDIGDVWDTAFDYKDNSVYLIANKKNGTNYSIYKVTFDSLLVQRITYDFPKKIEKNGGIALSSKGSLYFCGISEDGGDSKNGLFSFNTQDSSINIISSRIHSGTYRVFHSDNIRQP